MGKLKINARSWIYLFLSSTINSINYVKPDFVSDSDTRAINDLIKDLEFIRDKYKEDN